MKVAPESAYNIRMVSASWSGCHCHTLLLHILLRNTSQLVRVKDWKITTGLLRFGFPPQPSKSKVKLQGFHASRPIPLVQAAEEAGAL
jgi:hypothetical protein